MTITLLSIRSHPAVEEMKLDFVSNGITRVSMLLALWSELHFTADRHVDVFIKHFLALDFAYLTGLSDVVVQELATPLVDTRLHQLSQCLQTHSAW